jgi:hypothetical protein
MAVNLYRDNDGEEVCETFVLKKLHSGGHHQTKLSTKHTSIGMPHTHRKDTSGESHGKKHDRQIHFYLQLAIEVFMHLLLFKGMAYGTSHYNQPAFNSTTNKFRIMNFRLTKTSDWVHIPMCKLRTFSASLEDIRVPFYSGRRPLAQTLDPFLTQTSDPSLSV